MYNFDTKEFTEFLTQKMPDSVRRNYLNKDFTKSTAIRQSGFIAQEVEKAAKETGYNFNGVHSPESETDNYSLSYAQFVVPLVKGMQEQQKIIEELKQEIADLKKSISGTASLSSTETIRTGSIELSGKDKAVLNQNIPNPYNDKTTIEYSIPDNANTAQILFYNANGQLVKRAAITHKGKGQLTVFTKELNAGIYSFALLIDGKIVDTKKMIKQ